MKIERRTTPKKSVSTEEFAASRFVKPQSVRARLCREGHYFGVVPEKCPNGRLRWPVDAQ